MRIYASCWWSKCVVRILSSLFKSIPPRKEACSGNTCTKLLIQRPVLFFLVPLFQSIIFIITLYFLVIFTRWMHCVHASPCGPKQCVYNGILSYKDATWSTFYTKEKRKAQCWPTSCKSINTVIMHIHEIMFNSGQNLFHHSLLPKKSENCLSVLFRVCLEAKVCSFYICCTVGRTLTHNKETKKRVWKTF